MVKDNASYHTVQVDGCRTIATKKADIIALLIRHSTTVPQKNPIKATLLDVCKKYKPKPTYRIDGILRSNGHETLHLPPYHADINAIELIWEKLSSRTVDTIYGVRDGRLQHVGKKGELYCTKKQVQG